MTLTLAPFGILVIWGLINTVRDEIIMPKDSEKWHLASLLHRYPWWIWVIATLVIFIGVMLEGGFRLWRKEHDRADINAALLTEQQDQRDDEPDVILESSQGLNIKRRTKGSLESFDLVVYNDSADATARHVQISPLASGNYYAGFWSGDAATPAMALTENTALIFAPVPHLQGKSRAPVEPINPALTRSERTMQQVATLPATQRAADVSIGLWWFIDAVSKSRVFHEPAPEDEPSRQVALGRLPQGPIDISIRLTYLNFQGTRRWERVETFNYDTKTLSAYISHGERREIAIEEPIPAPPVSAIKLLCQPNRVELLVRNDGADACFWGTLKVTGRINVPPFDDLFCRWSHTIAAQTQIQHAQERRIVLADKIADADAVTGTEWCVYACAGGPASFTQSADEPVVTSDTVIEGSIVTDPGAANGIQPFRVILGSHEAMVG
ncbi:MAG TPA: hypothetical protein VLC46_04810 [Thermoanaerobaculia bacterium]|nr:hypothetical protein [Thermoanaerobaculia bacterium]